MGIITKDYTAVIVSGTTIQPSDTIAAFDKIYDLVNGGLDAANIATSFTVEASAITIVDTATYLSATRVNLIQPELTKKGWNTVHVLGRGTAGISIFPGVIEINGKYCHVNGRMDLSGVNQIQVLSSNSSRLWILTLPQAQNITMSDVLLIEYSTSLTAPYDVAKNGFYNGAGTRRAICVLRCDITGSGNDAYYDHQYLQRPSIGHRYTLSSIELSALGFTVTASNSLMEVVRFVDMDTLLSSYEIRGQFPTTATNVTIWADSSIATKSLLGPPFFNGPGNIGRDSSFFTHYYIHFSEIIDASAVRTQPGTSRQIINGGGTTLASIDFLGAGAAANASSIIRVFARDIDFGSGTWTFVLKKRLDIHSRVG